MNTDNQKNDPAPDVARDKVAKSYTSEPNAGEEALDVTELGTTIKRSAHQEFIYHLTTSGKSVAEIQTAWHEYYAGLPDKQKHQVWQEFYDAHSRSAKYVVGAPTPSQGSAHHNSNQQPDTKKSLSKPSRSVADLKNSVLLKTRRKAKLKPKQHVQSLVFGLGAGLIVLFILMFSFFNERFIAPFIQPSRNVTNTPIISDASNIGPSPEIIIPKINVEIPVIYDVKTVAEADVQKALENGVVHYAETSTPGTNGNVVIVGHSSNNIFNKGKYKFAFVLLSKMAVGDTFYLDKDGKRYIYKVYDKKIVKPTDVGVLSATADKPAIATLITCDPPGTSTNRLVVMGEQISPDPIANTTPVNPQTFAVEPPVIPGNSPSLWSRLTSIF
jgi:sortase A